MNQQGKTRRGFGRQNLNPPTLFSFRSGFEEVTWTPTHPPIAVNVAANLKGTTQPVFSQKLSLLLLSLCYPKRKRYDSEKRKNLNRIHRKIQKP
jgi:hypothetical protein